MAKTAGESVFEEFCALNHIAFEKIPEGTQPTPDYRVNLNGQTTLVEVKQIDADDNFTVKGGGRNVGSHVRKKIEQARKQAQFASNNAEPFILLVYNNLDEVGLFGTEQHDFIDAMYGEETLVLDKVTGGIVDSFHGRNHSLNVTKNTSFGAIGSLSNPPGGVQVEIYENVYAKHKIDFSRLPGCIAAVRIMISQAEHKTDIPLRMTDHSA